MAKYFALLDNIAAAAKAEKAAKKHEREAARVKRALAEGEWRRATVGLSADAITRIADEWAGRKA